MAERARKIKITNPDDNIDQDNHRESINLDTPFDLADALEAANKLPAVDESEVDNTDKPVNVIDLSDVSTAEPEVIAAKAEETPVEVAPSDSALKAELEKAKEDVKQAQNNYVRTLADLQNYRRRAEEEKGRIIRDANERLIKEILPVLDDFDLAVGAAKQSDNYEQLLNGVDAIHRKLHETLEKQGVEPIESLNQTFDPDLHEAVVLDDSGEHPDDTVTAELRKGYTLHKRVIRPSLVKVAKQ